MRNTIDDDPELAKLDRLLGEAEVCKMVGLSRVTIWRMEQEGRFPPRLRISEKRVAWRKSDILNWVENLGQI